MESTMAWMIGRPPTDHVRNERHLAHLRALREDRVATPSAATRIAGVVRGLRAGALGTATNSGRTLDVACCPA